jgi:hypothetical protein
LLQDGDIGVSVFPEGEEVLLGGFGSGGVALHVIGAAQLKMSKCTDR